MHTLCAWCGRVMVEGDPDEGVSHGICMDCALEDAYTRGWNDALHKVSESAARWSRDWGGAPVVPAQEKPLDTE